MTTVAQNTVAIFYKLDTGEITLITNGVDAGNMLEPGQDFITVEFDGNPDEYRVDVATQQLVEKPPTGARPVTWVDIRRGRDYLLSWSDWTQMPDTSLTPEQVEEAKAYRQHLRDLTELYNSPSVVVFPDPPAFMMQSR